jgi:PPOX class probable F420-dependent enzyme
MTTKIPNEFKDLLEKPFYGYLATLMPDNQPQLTVLWYMYDGEHVLVSTTRERQKAKNMLARPQVTFLAIDPENPFRYIEIRGTVEVTEEGGIELADQLTQRYTGKTTYYGDIVPAEVAQQETRVACKITPTRVRTYGSSE